MNEKKIRKAIKELATKRKDILGDFSRAYLCETGLKPSQVEMVEVRSKDKYVWYFQKKEERDGTS